MLLNQAKAAQTTAFITYIYQNTINPPDYTAVAHYVMIVFNPKAMIAYYIDPKGRHLEEESSQLLHPNSWKQQYHNLYTLFEKCQWINLIASDLQSLSHRNDTFCQTWSLMITLYVACDRVEIDDVTQFFSIEPSNELNTVTSLRSK